MGKTPSKGTGAASDGVAPLERVSIPEPNQQRMRVSIVGTAPLMVCRFSEKAMHDIRAKQELGSQGKKGGRREARDFKRDFEGARHLAREGGWDGIHAGAFRAGMISACRLVGYKMTLAKLSLFIEADGHDVVDSVPLVRIWSDQEPEARMMHTRNTTGVIDLRVRPAWDVWRMHLTVRFDGDQFATRDVLNLISRVGLQVGVGEGRPDSRNSPGIGYGTFRVADETDRFPELMEEPAAEPVLPKRRRK